MAAAQPSSLDGFVLAHLQSRGFTDAADERVYAAASERFWSDAKRSGCAP